jgi:type IV pilus assembly protein PilX
MNTLKGIPTMHTAKHSQQGMALITGLIFLVVLTLISMSAIKSTSLEERMAGNARDQDLAFQATEAVIRDAMKKKLPYLSPASAFTAGCAAGLCLNNAVTPVWTTITSNNQWTSSKTLAYSGTLDEVSTQPRYIVELLPASIPPPGYSMASGKGINSGAQTTPFRITARGWGLTGQAQATLQAAILY